jgi:hypothetical protein
VHATPHTRKSTKHEQASDLLRLPRAPSWTKTRLHGWDASGYHLWGRVLLVHYLLFWYFVVMDERHTRSSPDCRRLPRKRMKERKKERRKSAQSLPSTSTPPPFLSHQAFFSFSTSRTLNARESKRTCHYNPMAWYVLCLKHTQSFFFWSFDCSLTCSSCSCFSHAIESCSFLVLCRDGE